MGWFQPNPSNSPASCDQTWCGGFDQHGWFRANLILFRHNSESLRLKPGWSRPHFVSCFVLKGYDGCSIESKLGQLDELWSSSGKERQTSAPQYGPHRPTVSDLEDMFANRRGQNMAQIDQMWLNSGIILPSKSPLWWLRPDFPKPGDQFTAEFQIWPDSAEVVPDFGSRSKFGAAFYLAKIARLVATYMDTHFWLCSGH